MGWDGSIMAPAQAPGTWLALPPSSVIAVHMLQPPARRLEQHSLLSTPPPPLFRQAINASAEVIETTHAAVDLRHVLGIQAFSLDRVLAEEPDFLDVSSHLLEGQASEYSGVHVTCRIDRVVHGTAGWRGGMQHDAGVGLAATLGLDICRVPAVDGHSLCCAHNRPRTCRRVRSTPTPPA